MGRPAKEVLALDVNTVRETIVESGGLVSTMAKRLGVSLKSLDTWLDKHPALRVELEAVRADIAKKALFLPDETEFRDAVLAYDGNYERIGAHFGFDRAAVAAYVKKHSEFEGLIKDARQLAAHPERFVPFDPQPELVIQAINSLNGNLAGVAHQFHVSRSTMLGYVNAHPEVQAVLYDAREEMLDMAETSLYRRVLAGDAWAVCCLPDTQIMVPGGYTRPIQDFKLHQWVISHNGNSCMVEGVHERAYDGEVMALYISGLPKPLVVTPEHPIFARLRRGPQQRIRMRPLFDAQFVSAAELAAGDLVHMPVSHLAIVNDPVLDLATGFILGIYAAEGRAYSLAEPQESWQLKPNVTMHRTQGQRGGFVEFSLHATKDARLWQAITDYARDRLDNAPVYVRNHSQTETCKTVCVSDRRFARFCARMVGVGSRTKQLASDLMLAECSVQRMFLAGYLLGDGSISARKDGSRVDSITVTTASMRLAQQVFVMLSKCGIAASLQHGMNNGGPKNREQTSDKWTLYIRPREAAKLTAELQHEFTPRDARQGQRNIAPDGVWARIRKIEHRNYKGLVYNLQIATDATYVADFVSVHNCFFLKTQGRKRGYIERGESFNLNVNLDKLNIEQLERLAAGEHPSLVLGAAADSRSRAGSQTIDARAIASTSDFGAEEEAG